MDVLKVKLWDDEQLKSDTTDQTFKESDRSHVKWLCVGTCPSQFISRRASLCVFAGKLFRIELQNFTVSHISEEKYENETCTHFDAVHSSQKANLLTCCFTYQLW